MSENPRIINLGGGAALALMTILAACGGAGETETPSTATPPGGSTPTDLPETATEPGTPTRMETAPSTPTDAMPTDPPRTNPPVQTPTQRPTPFPTPTAVKIPTFELTRSYPERGAWAVSVSREFVVHFNEPFPQGYTARNSISLTLTSEGGTVLSGTPVDVTADTLGLRFSMTPAAGTRYSFDLEVNPQVPAEGYTYSGWFTTETPCGAGFDLAQFDLGNPDGRQLTITKFGLTKEIPLRSVNLGINSVPQELVALFVGVEPDATLPISTPFTAVTGWITAIDDTNGSMDPSLGFSTSADGCVVSAAGALTCSAPVMAIPINTATVPNVAAKQISYFYLRNAVVTGTVTAGAQLDLTSLALSGVVTRGDIDYFIANAGSGVAGVLAPIAANAYDTSYGSEDAITVIIEAMPVPFQLNDCVSAQQR